MNNTTSLDKQIHNIAGSAKERIDLQRVTAHMLKIRTGTVQVDINLIKGTKAISWGQLVEDITDVKAWANVMPYGWELVVYTATAVDLNPLVEPTEIPRAPLASKFDVKHHRQPIKRRITPAQAGLKPDYRPSVDYLRCSKAVTKQVKHHEATKGEKALFDKLWTWFSRGFIATFTLAVGYWLVWVSAPLFK